MASIPVDGRLRAGRSKLATVDMPSPGGALAPPSGSTRVSSYGSAKLRDVISLADWGADRTGATDSAAFLRSAVAEAQAIAATGYGSGKGAKVYVPAGKYLLGSKIALPEGVAIVGDGFGATTFLTKTGFADNCVFEPAAINQTQEFCGLSDFALYGQQAGSTPTNNQANAGTATTVATAVTGAGTITNFNLVAAGDISGYAASGTLTVGTKRVVYQSLDTVNTTFKACYVISNDVGVAISIGDAIAPVTTNNISGIHLFGIAFPGYLRNLWLEYFTGECYIVSNCTSCDFYNIEGAFSNRDTFLIIGNRASNFLSKIQGLYSGTADDGSTFAGLHLMGQNGTHVFGGAWSIDGFYSEQTAHNQIGVWLQNVGSVDAKNLDLQGGVNAGGTSYASQVGVQIDANISSPLLQDSTHAANISLRNISCAQIGRVLLKDNVRGYATPANTTSQGSARTRYDTEDDSPGSRATPTFSGAITPDRSAGTWQTITVTNGGVFTINAPTDPPGSGQTAELTIEIFNSSGGVLGAITWNAAYIFAAGAWVSPANTKKRFARFEWNGASWVGTSLAAADY